jgi:hypothetical protein
MPVLDRGLLGFPGKIREATINYGGQAHLSQLPIDQGDPQTLQFRQCLDQLPLRGSKFFVDLIAALALRPTQGAAVPIELFLFGAKLVDETLLLQKVGHNPSYQRQHSPGGAKVQNCLGPAGHFARIRGPVFRGAVH